MAESEAIAAMIAGPNVLQDARWSSKKMQGGQVKNGKVVEPKNVKWSSKKM
jgi:hypothetical protein